MGTGGEVISPGIKRPGSDKLLAFAGSRIPIPRPSSPHPSCYSDRAVSEQYVLVYSLKLGPFEGRPLLWIFENKEFGRYSDLRGMRQKRVFRHYMRKRRPPLWSGGQSFWLQIQRSWVRFPALPDFLRNSGSGTGSSQPREDN
jgi:hypothetical protein